MSLPANTWELDFYSRPIIYRFVLIKRMLIKKRVHFYLHPVKGAGDILQNGFLCGLFEHTLTLFAKKSVAMPLYKGCCNFRNIFTFISSFGQLRFFAQLLSVSSLHRLT